MIIGFKKQTLFWWCFCRTPLHAAAFTDHVECLQLLLSHNAQVNSVDAAGKTPLMMAAENGQTNAVGMNNLATGLENITVQSNQCCIELTLVVFFPPLTLCLELLVSSAKADLTLQDAVKNTALHLACSKVGILYCTIWWPYSFTAEHIQCVPVAICLNIGNTACTNAYW